MSASKMQKRYKFDTVPLSNLKVQETWFRVSSVKCPVLMDDINIFLKHCNIVTSNPDCLWWNVKCVVWWWSFSPLSGEFSDTDLIDVSKDDTYKPDKGKGTCYTLTENPWIITYLTLLLLKRPHCIFSPTGGHSDGGSDQINQYDDNGGGFSVSKLN